jgi:hypothetical protein
MFEIMLGVGCTCVLARSKLDFENVNEAQVSISICSEMNIVCALFFEKKDIVKVCVYHFFFSSL